LRTFVIGDIHGACRALKQCLQRSSFDYDSDLLICLGDVSDGWPETREAIDELLRIKNLVYIMGNHDVWTRQWMETREADETWLDQGGRATCDSYTAGIPPEHVTFFGKAYDFYVDEVNNRLFVHAGILVGTRAEECSTEILYWDRSLVRRAMDLQKNDMARQLTPYDEVFVGHTPIPYPNPMKYCEVWMVDTGAAWSGVLSIMNVDTKEYFTSDIVKDLYPNAKGR
jgi:serine/threonine protein phosphatase 1